MRNLVKQTAFLLIILGALAVPQTSRAGAKEEARKHYDRVNRAGRRWQPEGAIVEFQRSYDLTHHFAVLYNIGQVFVSLANRVEAVDAYQRLPGRWGKRIPAVRRAEVEQEIRPPEGPHRNPGDPRLPEGAGVRVDGKEIGKAPIAAPVRVGVGTHHRGLGEGYDPGETEVTVAGEDQKVVDLVLAKHVSSRRHRQWRRWYRWYGGASACAAADRTPWSAQRLSHRETAISQQDAHRRIVSGAVWSSGHSGRDLVLLTAKSRHDDAMSTGTKTTIRRSSNKDRRRIS